MITYALQIQTHINQDALQIQTHINPSQINGHICFANTTQSRFKHLPKVILQIYWLRFIVAGEAEALPECACA